MKLYFITLSFIKRKFLTQPSSEWECWKKVNLIVAEGSREIFVEVACKFGIEQLVEYK